MKAKYKHTNIIAGDWQKLAEFYEEVFGCQRVEPERHLSGRWLEQGTGVAHGGCAVGKVVKHNVNGAGVLTFIYAADPEGNIIELQNWE